MKIRCCLLCEMHSLSGPSTPLPSTPPSYPPPLHPSPLPPNPPPCFPSLISSQLSSQQIVKMTLLLSRKTHRLLVPYPFPSSSPPFPHPSTSPFSFPNLFPFPLLSSLQIVKLMLLLSWESQKLYAFGLSVSSAVPFYAALLTVCQFLFFFQPIHLYAF